VGFLGGWFFAILAPSSSVVPVATQTMAEHRMYLALAPVITLGVVGLYSLLGRRSGVLFLALAVGFGGLTVRRNRDYQSELSLWRDTVAKCPDNERAHDNLGNVLINRPGQLPGAIAEYETALRIKPNYAQAHYNLGLALVQSGRLTEAIAQYEIALRINPGSVEMHSNLGNALLNLPGHLSDAIAQYEMALRIAPDLASAHFNLGYALLKDPDRLYEGIAQYEAALRIDPDYAEAHNNLGDALLNVPGRLPEAIAQYKAALRLKPDLTQAREMLNRLQNANESEEGGSVDYLLRRP
jgi:tetratricopeptide (TPR) repeat protein